MSPRADEAFDDYAQRCVDDGLCYRCARNRIAFPRLTCAECVGGSVIDLAQLQATMRQQLEDAKRLRAIRLAQQRDNVRQAIAAHDKERSAFTLGWLRAELARRNAMVQP